MEFAGLDIGLNTLDLLLVVILFVGILIGFIRGAFSQIISAVSIWLGLVATLWLYKLFSDRIIQDGLGIGEVAGDTLAFLTLLLVFFNAFRLVVKALSTPPEERKKKKKKDRDDPLAEAAKTTSERVVGCLNAVGGMAMGFILTALWIALILGVIQFIFQPTGTDVPYSGLARGLVNNLRSSTLRPWFNSVLSFIVQSVDFFDNPKDTTNLLKVVLEQITRPG
jgi:hypothetical protein